MSSEVETSREFTRGLCRGIESLASRTPSAALQPRLRSERRCEVGLNTLQRIFITAFALVAAAQFARADSPSVTAVLSNSETVVGGTLELQIKVTGPGDAQPPEEISVDGLEIHATGQSRQFEIHNFATSSSVTYNYTILPLRAGRFTVPPQTVRAGGKLIRTPQKVLKVADSAGQPTTTRPNPGAQTQPAAARDL